MFQYFNVFLIFFFFCRGAKQCSGTGGSGTRGDGCRCCSMLRQSVGEYQCPVMVVVPSNGHSAGKPAATKKPETGGKKLRFQLAKERKASTTLGIIMSAFTVCWLPFFVLALVRPFLSDPSSIPSSLSSLFLWLGYANSLLNPVSINYRENFEILLYIFCIFLFRNYFLPPALGFGPEDQPAECKTLRLSLPSAISLRRVSGSTIFPNTVIPP